MKTNKILFTSDYPPLNGGGLSLNINELESILSEKGHTATIITSRIKDDFTNNSEYTKHIYSSNKIILVYKLINQIVKSNIVVINFTFSFRFLACLGLIFSLLFKKKVFLVFHTMLNHIEYNRLKKKYVSKQLYLFLLKKVANKYIKNIVFTDHQKKELLNFGIRKLDINPMPVIYDAKYNISTQERDIDIIYIGEVSKLKGVDYLINLINNTQLNITIIGDGESYNALIDETFNKKNVTLIKTKSHNSIIKYLKRSKYLFFPCLNDSWGRVVFEAMYTLTKVIAINNNSGVIGNLKSEQYIILDLPITKEKIDHLLSNDKIDVYKNLKKSIEINDLYLNNWINLLNNNKYENKDI